MSHNIGTLSGSISIFGNLQLTGSLLGTASWAVSSSRSQTASYIDVAGENITVNWVGSQLQLTASATSEGGSQVYISGSAPSLALPTGSLWWDSNYGVMSVLYNDGDSAQWVETNYGGTVATASSAISSVSASFAETASYFFTSSVSSASFALTASYISGAVVNIGDAYPSSPVCNKIVTLSQAEYDAIGTKDANTFYLITG